MPRGAGRRAEQETSPRPRPNGRLSKTTNTTQPSSLNSTLEHGTGKTTTSVPAFTPLGVGGAIGVAIGGGVGVVVGGASAGGAVGAAESPLFQSSIRLEGNSTILLPDATACIRSKEVNEGPSLIASDHKPLPSHSDHFPPPKPSLSSIGISSKVGGINKDASRAVGLGPGSLTGLLSQWGWKNDGTVHINLPLNAASLPTWVQRMDKTAVSKQQSASSVPTDIEARHLNELLTRERGLRMIVDHQMEEMRAASQELQQELDQEHAARVALEQRVRELTTQLDDKQQRVDELEGTLQVAQRSLEESRQSEACDWVLDRSEIIISDNIIGVGGWGRVLQGSFRKCTVAVKQIHELILSPHNRRLFEREMSIASRCRHPCLLQFIGATNDNLSPLFVTELLETSLRAVLHERSLSPVEIQTLGLDVAYALNYLHENKPMPIIHRDISSANVLLWKHHDCWRGKVSDYGTANFMNHTMTVSPGAVVYSAPEAQTSRQSPKVDVYSFGVLLCEMNIREFPDVEQREQQVALVTSHASRDLIRRCFHVDADLRPSMADVIDTLEAIPN